MLKDITLGQYFPGKSFIHLLDPRTKLVMVVLYIVALFTAGNLVSYGLVFAFLVMCIRVSKIPLKAITRGMKPVAFIVIFTGILNLFFTPGEQVIFQIFGFAVTWEAVRQAFFMVSRILMLISGTFLLTYTTSPIALTDGLVKTTAIKTASVAIVAEVVLCNLAHHAGTVLAQLQAMIAFKFCHLFELIPEQPDPVCI